jgi:hypothetical protein
LLDASKHVQEVDCHFNVLADQGIFSTLIRKHAEILVILLDASKYVQSQLVELNVSVEQVTFLTLIRRHAKDFAS